MTSTHTSYNFNRRNSSTAPYSIPIKQQQQPHPQHPQQHGHPLQMQQSPHTGGPISSSVPILSREFVVRRISEGETGRLKEELKCEACGKGYKHISSLAKHLWEHTPEWNVTKKLLISKHQQVQLLEAASILVSMNDTLPPGVSGSRKNSVFETIDEDRTISRNPPHIHHRDSRSIDDNDPKSSSPFSPANSLTAGSSNTPTPPINHVPSSSVPTFKSSFMPHNNNIPVHAPHDSSYGQASHFANYRNSSSSQYPPTFSPMKREQSSASDTPSNMNGGYLDVPSSSSSMRTIQQRQNSIVDPRNSQMPSEFSFKSPSNNSFRLPNGSFMNPSPINATHFADRAHQNGVGSAKKESDENESTFDDDDEDGVFGNMEE